MHWSADYIGIPYAPRGRERDGVDCWGLVCLIYRDRYGIELPGGGGDYDPADGARVAQIFSGPERDDWRRVEEPYDGDVVLLKILGYPAHVGVLIDAGQRMVHAREGHAAVVEHLDRGAWRHRVEGYYRHAGRDTSVVLSGVPHPLRTSNISGICPEGATLGTMIRVEAERAGVPLELVTDGHAWIDGEYISAAEWEARRPRNGQRVEFRVLPRGSVKRALLMVLAVVAVFVFRQHYLLPLLTGGIAGATLTTFGTFLYVAGGALATMAAMALVNAIAPIRPPELPGGMTPIKDKNRLQGGANTLAPYGAVPVVLGEFRYTPPSAANPYVETESNEQYLRMLLCWGYGTLAISDMRIKDTALSEYEDVEVQSLSNSDTASPEARAAFDALYGQDVTQQSINIKLETDVLIDRTIAETVDYVLVNLHFPAGIWKTPTSGGNAGEETGVDFKCNVFVAAAGSGVWYQVDRHTYGATLELPISASITTDAGVEIPLYTWHTVAIDRFGAIIYRTGTPTESQNAEPSEEIVQLLQAAGMVLEQQTRETSYGVYPRYTRLPRLGSDETALYDVCVLDDAIVTTTDRRPAAVTGCGLTTSGTEITVAAGDFDRSGTSQLFTVHLDNHLVKEAFDITVRARVAPGSYDVRVHLVSSDENEGTTSLGHSLVIYHDCYYTSLTGMANQKPVNAPASLALTAIRIRASNQLNGVVDGITGTCRSICMDWDAGTSAWVYRHTRNPASLFRYVLQHPANPRPVSTGSINLVALQEWHAFCVANGFIFDTVQIQQRPLLDLLRDIAAAGRASPTIVDGKWSVVVDTVRTTVVQHFTPHNSWGFEGQKLLPKIPHALRVRFYNRSKGYQLDERFVYADGYTESNATLFEQVDFPGVTEPAIIQKLGRFHLAQLQLRPERYTINTDLEHLICTRGDLVRVTHEVPMWGLGSGRIRSIATSGPNDTGITLDEAWPMKASGASYEIRFRLDTGATLTKAVANPVADGEYSTLTFTTPFTSGQINVGDLCLFGELDAESVELIVQSIEPDTKGNARITLYDYAPAIFDVDSEEIPAFDSHITLPPELVLRNPASTHVPIINDVIADEGALVRTAQGNLQAGITVSYRGVARLPASIRHVEVQYARAGNRLRWTPWALIPATQRSVWIGPLRERNRYFVRLRFVARSGYVGPWATTESIQVVGRRGLPDNITNLTISYADSIGLTLDWDDCTDLDFRTYVIKRRAAFGTETWDEAELVRTTPTSSLRLGYPALGSAYVYIVKARDVLGNESAAEALAYVAVSAPIVAIPAATVIDHLVQLNWVLVPTTYPISSVEIRKGSSWAGGTVVGTTQGQMATLIEMEAGTYTYRIKAVDIAGNASDEALVTAVVGGAPDYTSIGTYEATLA